MNKLLEQTRSGEIEWGSFPVQTDDELTGPAYWTNIKGHSSDRWIAIYGFRYRSYSDEDKYEYVNDVAIVFAEPNGAIDYRWPKTTAHRALLDAVQFQASKAQNFLDDFVGDDFD